MNRSLKFFLSVCAAVLGLNIGFTGVVAAQEVQSTCTGCITTTPAPQPTFSAALSFSAWQMSNGGAVGQNAGGDGRGVVQTIAENLTRMTLDGSLAANTNIECGVDCNLTQNRFQVNTSLITGASATNQGVGNSPVSSAVRSESFGTGGMQLRDVYVLAPAAAP